MDTARKQISFHDAPAVMTKLRKQGRIIVQCHGTFDLIHPGHIIHFEEAKALGDVLVVSITSERYVNKGPGRPFFSDHLRVKALTALAVVDYVVVVPFSTAVEAIECIRPAVYCKGKEYAQYENDVTGNIRDEARAVKRCGGVIRYVGSVVFSSTSLLNRNFNVRLPSVATFCRHLSQQFSPDEFRKTVDNFSDVRVLIIGDIIFDRYTTVTVQGLTSKNRIISGRILGEETQLGGALAVFRHMKQLVKDIKIIGLIGAEKWAQEALQNTCQKEENGVLRDAGFTTIVKQRFVEPLKEGKELSKLFSVNYIDAKPPSIETERKVCSNISNIIKNYDLVIVLDFGHGIMTRRIRDLVQDKAAFLSLNCQTNSNNHGFNIINRQYSRCDSFSLDEMEIKLAVGVRDLDYKAELKSLKKHLHASYSWLTRGAFETIGMGPAGSVSECPPFEVNVVDTVGAGDAFFAYASLAGFKKLPINEATFLGQLAGAMAVKIVGNATPVMKSNYLKAGISMLS